MTLLQSILFGFLQGVTEFLPVSSSGHLAILKNLFGLQDVGIAFDVLLHVGTLVAVFVAYWQDVVKLVVNGVGIIVDFFYNIYIFIQIKRGYDLQYRHVICSAYRKFALLVVVSTIPTGLMYLLTGNIIEAVEKTLIVPGICLLITGVVLLIADELPDGYRTPKHTSYLHALLIGTAQGFAMLPGLSRSGTTITAGLACGLRRDFAVKYSFLMSIPAIMGAAIVKLKDLGGESVGTGMILNYIAGAAVAAVVGYICIKTMLVIVKRKNFKVFAVYCFIVGFVAIIRYFVA